ncbi:hypothetical protein [Pseudomonas sp. PONIH3]|uniref:hypothetical protein n=1 Tax=Pseudomonas sp. PONIH3 TaxID=1636610 RepID=UPI003D2E0F64
MTGINRMREQFEAWVLREWSEQSLARFTTGEYQGFTVEHCWQAWQASREALVVELPARQVYESHADTSSFKDGFNRCHTESRDLIEAQGLKLEVKS